MRDEFESFLQSGAPEQHRTKRALEEAKRSRDAALAAFQEAERRLDLALSIGTPPKKIRIRKRGSKHSSEACPIFMASDWHVEETVDPKTVNGRNQYDPKIAERRAETFFERQLKLVELARAGWKIHEAVLWLGGDLITGYIHEELLEANAMSPTEAILFAERLIAGGIDFLLAEGRFERLVVVCNYGNHGRTTPFRRIATGSRNSFEWLMYHALRKHYRAEPRVEFLIADGAHAYLPLYDGEVRFTHGDDVRYAGGVGGLSIPLRKAIDAWDQFRPAMLTVIGHWHQLTDYQFCVVNGSLIGFNAYALSIKARYEPPQQGFVLMDSRRGKAMFAPVWVGE